VTPGGRWTPVFVVALSALLPSLPVLQGDFLADDFGCLRLWGEKPLRDFLVLGDMSEGIWGIPLDEARPLDALAFRLGYWISGGDAIGHLGLALALHVACSVLVYLVTRLAGPSLPRRAALAAGLLFAAHPVHAETIAWVSGKVDSLATSFYLAALALYLSWRASGRRLAYAACLATFGLGLFAKEILLTLTALIAALDLVLLAPGSPKQRLVRTLKGGWAYAPFVTVAALYLLGRRLAFGSFAREHRLGAGLWELLWQRQAFNLGELLLPVAGWGRTALALAALAVLALLLRERAALKAVAPGVFLFGIFFYAASTAPLLLTYASARHLYLPSAGLAVAAGMLWFPSHRARLLRGLALLAALFALVPALWARERPWIEAGEASRRIRLEIERATRDLPLGATVILSGIPATAGDVLVWRAALPFALEPPFVPRNVAGTLRLIESPDLYCCPAAQWWERRAATLASLETGDAGESLALHLLEWRPAASRLARRDVLLERAALWERLERSGAAPSERGRGLHDAARLVAALAQAARGAPRVRVPRR
jgi:hypothetical protein